MRRETPRAPRPLRLLFLAASAEGVEPVLAFEEEETGILEATRKAGLELVVEESGSLAGIAERIGYHGTGYFDVFHLSGHAGFAGGEPVFLLEDDFGRTKRATAGEIAEAFGGRWPSLVFLSGCSTGEARSAGALPSFCVLVAAGAPAGLAFAEDRAISEKGVQRWLQELQSDPAKLLSDLDDALVQIVGETPWLFDRSLLPSR